MAIFLGLESGGALLQQNGFHILVEGVFFIPDFPDLPGLGYPITRTSIWKTITSESVSGKTTTVPLMSWPRYRYEVPFNVLRSLTYIEIQTLIDFVDQIQGGALPFYYDDPDDDTASASAPQPIGTGDGTTRAFQLYRAEISDGFAVPVQSPNPGVIVYVNGSPTSAFVLSAGGVVTFNSAPANGAVLTWSGTYRWLCRLDSDQTPFEKSMSWIWGLKKLAFTTVKL